LLFYFGDSLLVIVQLETADDNQVIFESISIYLSVIVDSCIEVSCRLSIGVQMLGIPGFHWFALSANNKSISLGPQNVGNMLHVVRKKAAFTVGYDCTKARKQNVDFSEKITQLLTTTFTSNKVKSEDTKKLAKEDLTNMQKDIKVLQELFLRATFREILNLFICMCRMHSNCCPMSPTLFSSATISSSPE
jgi:hypothetical protein